MKRVIGVVVAVMAVSGAAWGFFFKGPSKTPQQFVTQPASRGDVSSRVTATGTLSALVTVQVGTQVSGRIQELNADFNTRVKKGQVLATLDQQLFNAALAQANANERAAVAGVTKAKAQALDSERQLKRTKQLAGQNYVAQADLDTAQSAYEVAVASIDSAEAALAQSRAQRQQAQVNLAYTTITSPIDGTIISRAVDVGQTVAASLSSPTLFTIAENLERMQVDTSVAEADVGKLKEGGDATFTVDAFPGRKFSGRVRQIRYAATVVSNVVTYDAVIDVQNPELLLRPGMTANVTFVTGEAHDVVRVPNAALRFKLENAAPQPGKRTIAVLKDGKPQSIPVVTGLTDGTFTEVVSGLEGGEQVITNRSGAAGAPAAAGAGARGGGQRNGGMGRIL
ncbi:MAG: efflux RND transporter periplasmic adaptor subunit [Archangium sp.]